MAAQSLWGFVCRKPELLGICCDENEKEQSDGISKPIISYFKEVHGFDILVFQMHRMGGDVLCYEKRKVYSVIWCFVFTVNLGPDNTKRPGAGSEGRGNAVVKKTNSSCSLTYVAQVWFVYYSCRTCSDWKLAVNSVVMAVFESIMTKLQRVSLKQDS